MQRLRRFLPLLILAAAIGAIWVSGIADELSWATLAREQARLQDWVDEYGLLAATAYVAIYVAVVALSLPQASVMTIAGGLLFGTLLGGALAVIGATIGAIILFLIARSAFGETLASRGGRFLQTVRDGLQRDGFSYLLAIRLIPAFPFWLVNLAAALGGMRLTPYAAATLIGVAPATFILASVGAGIGTVLAVGQTPDLSVIFSLPVLGPLVALALLSLLPVAWRKWKNADA
ncbi:MAG: TVP38/TMEM64 family protein [Acetobacteraceae bacterium]